MPTLHLIVSGRVQGVGFRWFVVRAARERGVSGRVWNRSDGAVELEAHGSAATLAELAIAIRRGPPGARVEDMVEDWTEAATRHEGFEISG